MYFETVRLAPWCTIPRSCSALEMRLREDRLIRTEPFDWAIGEETQGRIHHVFFFFFFKLSSGGWVKIKLKLPHFHVSDTSRVSV